MYTTHKHEDAKAGAPKAKHARAIHKEDKQRQVRVSVWNPTNLATTPIANDQRAKPCPNKADTNTTKVSTNVRRHEVAATEAITLGPPLAGSFDWACIMEIICLGPP